MLTFYKIVAKHAHHRSPPQYINTSQYIQQRPNTIYRIGCQRLRIANTNIYRDTSVLIPVLNAVASLNVLSMMHSDIEVQIKGFPALHVRMNVPRPGVTLDSAPI